jgi:serine/threonine protein phosphatase 1
MATIAIGDIHGNLAPLDDLLSELAPELTAEDTVVFLGDYIDRGSNTRGCIDRMLEFQSGTPARVVGLLGNHEDWMLRSLRDPTGHSWVLGMEAFTTIASYSMSAAAELRSALQEAGPRIATEKVELPYSAFLATVLESHVAFFDSLALYHRTPDAICVHGGLDPRGGTVKQQRPQRLLWGANEFLNGYQGEEIVVYGHWSNADLDA